MNLTYRKAHWNHFLIAFVGVLTFSTVIGLISYAFIYHDERVELFDHFASSATYEFKRNDAMLERTVHTLEHELDTLGHSSAFAAFSAGGFVPNDKAMSEAMELILRADPALFQVRFLGVDGRERIRIDRTPEGEIRYAQKLQNKSGRYYFQKTRNLENGSYYISELDLNVENGVIDRPFRPTLRVAKPIYSEAGIFAGMFVLNYLADEMIADLKRSEHFDVFVIDKNGKFLLHPDSEKQWSSQLGHYFAADQELAQEGSEGVYRFELTHFDATLQMVYRVKRSLLRQMLDDLMYRQVYLFGFLGMLTLPLMFVIALLMSRQGTLIDFVINTLPHPLYVKKRDGVFVMANDALARRFGLTSRMELIGKNSYLFFQGQQRALCRNRDDEAFTNGELELVEEERDDNDNVVRYVKSLRVRMAPSLLLPSAYMLGIEIDISELKEKEHALEALNGELNERIEEAVQKAKVSEQLMQQQARFAQMGEMIRMIAHQWRQPLNAISAASIRLTMLQELGELGSGDIRDQSRFIESQAQKMSKTINDFMDFFKPDKETVRLSLAALLQEIDVLMGAQLASRGIVVKADAEHGCGDLECYKNEMLHVLINLIANARDAYEERSGDAKREIILGIEREGATVSLWVQDFAGGIAPELLDRVFNPYFTTKEQGQGTGIGLFMSRRIVEELFAGTLGVENRDGGARFTIRFDELAAS